MLLCSCAPALSVDSFEELAQHSTIISTDSIEVDIEYLEFLDLYVDNLRQEYIKYVEFQYEYASLIPPEKILCYKIRYKVDDAEVVGYISAPADYQTTRYPVLIYNRGGNGNFAALEAPVLQRYAQYGFIVLATNYRGVDGGTGKDEFGGADVADVIKLIDYAEMFSFTNGKIYMFGWSRGAMQTYIVLSRDERIDAAVAGAGPTDLIRGYEEREDMRSMMNFRIGLPDDYPEEYEARSALCWPERINTHLFIVHGTADDRVFGASFLRFI